MQFDRHKLKAVILYTAFTCLPGRLGAVKLHKVLYFVDMLHYADAGVPVTGSTYRKRPLGPTCDQLLPMLTDLCRTGELTIREVDYFGYRKKEYEATESPDVDRLSESERSLLDEVIQFVCYDNSAKAISEFSHNRAWEMVEYGEVLPYNSVFHIFPSQVSLEAMEWADAEVSRIEAEGSTADSVGTTDYRAFRSRVLEALGR
jgi:hypothetical protein